VNDIILMSDPRVAGIPSRECGEPLSDLRQNAELRVDPRQADPLGAFAHVRQGVLERLLAAQRLLPAGRRLLLVEGYRPLVQQIKQFDRYADTLRQLHPGRSAEEVHQLASRSLAPPEIGPHVCGAAIDLTLCTTDGVEIPMGTEVNASPEESAGGCYTDAANIEPEARLNRQMLSTALAAAGLVNYPTEWWHWSYGDRYWAVITGAPAAVYGQLDWLPVA
jgi:zinc D-Ala-D-Ala dipeptidase